MIRGVVFDLFHTLTGRESEWTDLPFTADAIGIDRPVWDQLLHSGSRWRLTGEERDHFRVLRRLADSVDPTIPDDRIRNAVETRSKRFRGALERVPPENVRALRALRAMGLPLGLVSNADVTELLGWNTCPLCGLFDAEVFSCEVGWVKPEPEIFHACLDTLGLRANQCVYVGDGGSNELTVAKALGFETVFVSGIIAELWPARVPERLAIADHHIEQLPDILHLVNRLRGGE